MLLLEGSLRLKAGKFEASRPMFVAFVKACNEEAGCLEFSFSQDICDGDVLNIRERFVDEAAFQAHQQAEHTIAFKKQLYALGVEARDVRYYENITPTPR
ncbi:putative quinol monooxygenase [Hirschia litorea]|uniref:Quinol monooxygenase n=1 Tax=Hirschia litorea TaxID=1199156 RepID=A0ABW2IKV1_9PROT